MQEGLKKFKKFDGPLPFTKLRANDAFPRAAVSNR